jgi:uncharacterized protein (DUF983 family)
MVRRALRRRCPWCNGKRAWFNGWFRRADRCHTCGLRWNRGQDGFELGAMTMAVFITGGSVMIFLAIGIIASYPKVAVLPLALGGAAIAVLVPMLTYPFTYTIWSAFDLAVHPPSPEEFGPADTHADTAAAARPVAPIDLAAPNEWS